MFNKQKKKQGFLAGALELAWLLLIVFLIRTFGFGLYQVPTGSMETTMLVGERFFADKFTYNFIRTPKRGDIIAFNNVMFKYSNNIFKRFIEEYIWGPDNVTKRVIGEPGDTVKGVVENGTPVIYINGKKLDEPYLNKYPLLTVYSDNPTELRSKITKELRVRYGQVNSQMVKNELKGRYTVQRSYDPNVSYDNQPFYIINPNWVYKKPDGKRRLIEPGTPYYPKYSINHRQGNNYWNGSDEFYVELGNDEYWCMGDNRLGSADSRFFGPVKKRFIHGRIVFRIWSLDSYHSWFIFDLIRHPIDFWTRVRWSRCLQFIH